MADLDVRASSSGWPTSRPPATGGPYHTPEEPGLGAERGGGRTPGDLPVADARAVGAGHGGPGDGARVADEVADVLAYLLQFCDVLGIDVLAALAAKIERNESRFPVPESGSDPPVPGPAHGSTDDQDRHSSE